MKIKCQSCGFTEKTDKELFVKVLGAAMPAFGFWAWTSFLFAGTGFAMAICVAIIAGGPALLMYKDEIVQWLVSKGYGCPKCGSTYWDAIGDKEVVAVPNSNKQENKEDVNKPKIRVRLIDKDQSFVFDCDEMVDELHIQKIKKMGEINNGNAENALSDSFYLGKGAKQDYVKAYYWANIAAQKGNQEAQRRISLLYRFGRGIIQDTKMADYWLSQSKKMDDDLKELASEITYLNDFEQITELRGLIKRNNGSAESRLGQIYYGGIKIDQNYVKAFQWSKIAAMKGDKSAQFRLSNLYRNGWGVVRDEQLAQFWLEKSKEK